MIRDRSLRVHVAIFSILFASGMWMSKVAQPLHFQEARALAAFGIGYAVMACVGGLSFAWGALADRIGGLSAVRIGTLAYAVGIAGRVFTDLLPTILASAIAGAGASLALVAIRPWIRSMTSDEEVPRVVATRSFGSQAGVFVGTLGAAGLFLLSGERSSGTTIALLAAAVIVAGGFVWLCFVPNMAGASPIIRRTGAQPAGAGMRTIAIKLAVVGLLSGFYVSLVTPYLPLFLTGAGLNGAAAASVIAVMSAVQMGVTAVLARRGISTRPIMLFLVAEATTAAATFAVALLLDLSSTIVVVLFVARAAFVSIAVTAEETIQYAVIPGSAAGFVFGISQTAFLVGDALGGAAGGPIWTAFGPAALALIAAAATATNALLFPLMFRRRAGLRASETVDATA